MPPYNANIPQAPDQLSQSQPAILGNFQAIATMLPLTVGSEAVIFPRAAAAPVTGAITVALYGADSVSSPGTTALFFKNQTPGGVSVDITSYGNTAGNIGWCRLPCGIIMKWGVSLVGPNGALAATLANGVGIPTIVTLLSAQITSYGQGQGDAGVMYFTNFDEVGHVVNAWYYKAGPNSHNAGFYYLLMGL